MNAKQKLHQAKIAQWTALIRQQTESGLPIKEWCIQNNQSFHAYNYWKHIIKETVVESILPDIFPLSPSTVMIPSQSAGCTIAPSPDLCKTDILRKLPAQNASISMGDIRIEIGSNASDDVISSIIKAVRHV